MGKRPIIVTALLAAIGLAFYACGRTTSPDTAPATTGKPAGSPAQAVAPRDVIAPAAQTVVGEPSSSAPSPQPAPSPAAQAESPPVNDAAAQAAPIHGNSPCPTTGKPVAAVDIDWDIQSDPAESGTFRGNIGAINLAGPARVQISVAPLGDLAVISPASCESPALARGERLALPVTLRLAPASTGQASLVVMVRVEAATIRSRVVNIPIRAQAPQTPHGDAGTVPGSAPPAEHTLNGSDGMPVHFMPASDHP